ncbi:MAG: hypothetical protein M3P93_03905, partial [Actinomycetota bacterium]|nr:hypothetical protein [Actinomycetota bacterium]
VYDLVQRAHLGTAALARALAVGLDARDEHPGSTTTSLTAELRASTVNLMQAHVVQTGLASDAALTYGLRSPAYAGAAAALGANTNQLTAACASCPARRTPPPSGPSGSATSATTCCSSTAWSSAAPGAGPPPRSTSATSCATTAVQLSRVTGVPAAEMVPELRVHVAGTLTVIRLQAARDPRQFTAAAVGALHFAAVGDAVAASAAERLAVEG